MGEHIKPRQRGTSQKVQNRRVGASVLVAAASLLGTSLGFSVAALAEPLASDTPNSAGPNTVGNNASEKKVMLALKIKSANTQFLKIKSANPEVVSPKGSQPRSTSAAPQAAKGGGGKGK
jgi:hypothetical protein